VSLLLLLNAVPAVVRNSAHLFRAPRRSLLFRATNRLTR